jgi:hypothetical protein
MAKKAKNPGPLCFPRRAFLKLRDPAKRGVEGRYSRANPQTVLDEVRNFCSRGKCHPVSGARAAQMFRLPAYDPVPIAFIGFGVLFVTTLAFAF